MSLVLLGLGALSLTLPGLKPSLSLRGNPRWFVLLDSLAMMLGVVSIMTGLAATVALGALGLAAGAPLGRYNGHLTPGGAVVWAASLVALVMLVARLALAARRAHKGRRVAYADRWLGHHQDLGDHELVVVPTDDVVAYSVEGSPPQIVISEGFLNRFEDDVVGFVVEHERSHLRRRHRRPLLVAAYVDAIFGRVPWVARSVLALRISVERDADEDAAGLNPQRRWWAGVAMETVCGADVRRVCGAEALRYRARALVATPSPGAGRGPVAAAAGLALIAAVAVATVGHVGGDVPSLLATLW